MARVRRTWMGPGGIKKLAKELGSTKQQVETHAQDALEFCVKLTYEEYLRSLPPGLQATADIAPPQQTGKNSWRYRIVNSSDHAAFVEYGTGDNGKGTYPKEPDPEGTSWVYNSGAHSSKDEYYSTKKGTINVPVGAWLPNGFAGYVGRDGKKHIVTHGQKAGAQMYRAMEYYKENREKWLKYYFQQNGIDLK